MFEYRLFTLITRLDTISTLARVIPTVCLLWHTGGQWASSLHTPLSASMCFGFVFAVWPTTKSGRKVHTTPSRLPQLCGEKRTISLPWFISVLWETSWDISGWHHVGLRNSSKGPRRKAPFQLRGGNSCYLFASVQQRSSCVFALRPTWRAPYPTGGSEPNAYGMNGVLAGGET